jgi:hypothetical protein
MGSLHPQHRFCSLAAGLQFWRPAMQAMRITGQETDPATLQEIERNLPGLFTEQASHRSSCDLQLTPHIQKGV